MNSKIKTAAQSAPGFWSRIAAVAGAATLMFNASTALASNIFNLSIPSTVAWTDTGIFVPSGTFLSINASGTVVYGPFGVQTTGPDGGNYENPQHFPTAVLPDTYIVSLIGKIGGTTAVGTGTPVPEGTPGQGPGFVGSAYGQFIATGGELFLGFNDQVGQFDDNGGSFSAIVTVPEPSVCALASAGMLVFLAGMKKVKKQAAV